MKLIFSDLDGTLLTTNKQILSENILTLKHWIQTDNIFIPVSARMPEAITSLTDQISKQLPIIAYNGALILDPDGQTIFSETIAMTVIHQLLGELLTVAPELAWNLYCDHTWYSPKKAENLEEERIVHISSQYLPDEKITSLPAAHKLLLIGNPKVLTKLKGQFLSRYAMLNFINSNPNLLEITSKSVNKGQAINFMLNHFQLTTNDAWTFGDNYNDLEMLQNVGHPILMANAPDSLKRQFSIITTDNDHSGISQVIEQIM